MFFGRAWEGKLKRKKKLWTSKTLFRNLRSMNNQFTGTKVIQRSVILYSEQLKLLLSLSNPPKGGKHLKYDHLGLLGTNGTLVTKQVSDLISHHRTLALQHRGDKPRLNESENG